MYFDTNKLQQVRSVRKSHSQSTNEVKVQAVSCVISLTHDFFNSFMRTEVNPLNSTTTQPAYCYHPGCSVMKTNISPVSSGGKAHLLLFKRITLSNFDLVLPVGREVIILDLRIPEAK